MRFYYSWNEIEHSTRFEEVPADAFPILWEDTITGNSGEIENEHEYEDHWHYLERIQWGRRPQ